MAYWSEGHHITVLPQEHLPKSILRTLPKDLLMEAKASCEQRHPCWLEREYNVRKAIRQKRYEPVLWLLCLGSKL
jgi:hypothetical protein